MHIPDEGFISTLIGGILFSCLSPYTSDTIIHFQNPPVIIHGFEINGAKSQIDNINLLSEQIDKDLKEYKFLNKIKNPIIRNLLMKIADINNPRMHQYFVDDLLTTSDPEIKLYKFNSKYQLAKIFVHSHKI